jgi:DNA-binding NarL/FixJ family response regulator
MSQKLLSTTSSLDKIPTLSPKEWDVLTLLALGLCSKHIAVRLGVMPKSIDNYKNRIGKKLGLKGYGLLARFAVANKDMLQERRKSLMSYLT